MKIITFTVRPNIPEKLKQLDEIAHNLWVSWNFDAIQLFIRLDYDTWLQSRQNPVKMLGLVSQDKLEEMAGDDSFMAALNTVYDMFRKYIDGSRWYSGSLEKIIAYFSMEYGIDIHLPIYSGGLGILAADHLKSSSDLGLPLVGVGLLYRQGYFRQYLNPDGYQQESYTDNDWYNLPVRKCIDRKGKAVKISVDIGESNVIAKVWVVSVGRNVLYLLDTNCEENSSQNRAITDILYGGDREMRIRQEILLGVGGIRALKALGINPVATHMNEGHSAFLAIEKIRVLIQEQQLSFDEAVQATKPTNIFTTHTPVPAGNERFSTELMKKYFGSIAHELGLAWKDFLALGRENPKDDKEPFCLTILALKLSCFSNGVSRLHGKISRNMWKNIWPTLSEDEIPIIHITNGVHPRTWLSHNMIDLLDRYFGPRFKEEPAYLDIWDRMTRISDEELWRTHERRRERLVAFARHRLKTQYIKRGMAESDLTIAGDVLSPYTLTICFARRFATYKRGTLLLKDPERLIRLLSSKEYPIQLIFAGKAHPQDIQGKEIIKEIVHFAREPRVRSRIVFLEDYDITIARYFVSGSDVWLNTPRRPLEASGTSGMKAAMNGSLNVSILDGWWEEAYLPEHGWAIGKGEEYGDPALQDDVESNALYDLLEDEIIPIFYSRGRDGLPREWIKRMKAIMSHVGRMYSSQRMLMEYYERFYIHAMENHEQFKLNRYARAKDLAAYINKISEHWRSITIECRQTPQEIILKSGDKLSVSAKVNLGGLETDDVAVELYYGPLSSKDKIFNANRLEMSPDGMKNGYHQYLADFECRQTGRQAFAVRVMPKHPALKCPFIPEFIKWA